MERTSEYLHLWGGNMKVKLCFAFLVFATLAFSLIASPQAAFDWKPVDTAMGRQGADQPDGTHRFAMPRSDLKVTVAGIELKAGFALGSWAAFQNMSGHSAVMGDLV